MFLRLLFIGSRSAGEAIADRLRSDGIDVDWEIAGDPQAVERALTLEAWNAVISDDVLDGWSGLDALRVVREHDPDVPFILLSGTIGEELAVEAMRAGASDYVMKDRLGRLLPALEREIRDAATRRERTHLYAELRKNKERFRRTFEKAPLGIANISASGHFTTVNDRFAEMVGYTPRDLIGIRFTDLLHPDEIAEAEARHAAFVEGSRAKSDHEHRLMHRDGRTLWVYLALSPIFGPDDRLEQVVTLVQDITLQRAATQRVALQAQLLDSVEQAVIASDAEGRITYWNRYAEKLYGWRMDEVFGRHVLDVTIAPSMRAAATPRVARLFEGESWSGESLMMRRDGTTFQAWVVAAPIYNGDGEITGGVAVSHDITRLKQAEEATRRYAVQQSVAANLGHLALSGAPLETLFREAATFIRDVLGADFSEVVKSDPPDDFVMVAGEGWEPGVVGDERPGGERSLPALMLLEPAPLASRDVNADPRITPSTLLVRHGARGAAVVPILTAGEPWGLIGAYARDERLMTESDIDFLRTIATVLGQAIERVRADVQVRIRAVQQSAIAELGRLAFSTVDQHTLDRACELAQNGLGVDFALFLELVDDELIVRAAPSWPEEIGRVIPVADATQSCVTARTRTPVVVSDYATDERFSEFARTRAAANGARSGMSVPIVGARTFFGVLAIYSSVVRDFPEADVNFLQSLANTLAEAMERERATRALVSSEQRYRSVVEGASEIIFEIDRNGIVSALNRAFETITGHRCESFLGRHFSALFDGPDAARAFRLFLRRPRNAQWEAAVRRADGSRVLLDVSVTPRMENGTLVALHGFARDITEARRIESERQQLTANLQLLLESTAEGLFAIDVDGRCQLVNRAAERMLGHPVDDVTGRNMHDLTHGGAAHGAEDCPMHDVLKTGMTITVADDTFRRADGSPFPVEYSAAPMIDDGRVIGVVVTFTDITERRKLEQKLEQANRLSSLGRLAVTIAHEVNNVLMGIAPFVEIIRRTGDRDRIESSLAQIAQSVARGKRITSEILRFTQPAEPVRARIDVAEWLDTVRSEARSLLPPTVILDLASEEELAIDGDANQLHQTLMNLILNARDAMPGGGLLTIRAERAGAFIHLSVTDNGTGMSTETQRHIFEPLFTTKKSGTGLGLPLAHQIVTRHGGEISVESAIGVGTTFHVFLPASWGAAEPAPEPLPAPPPATAPPHRKRRVLLVEDDPTVAAGIVALLQMEGLAVDIADTGTAAIAMIRSDPPDVVVLDVGLPDMEGTAVYDAIAITNPDLPVIFSTGHADASRLEEYLSRPRVSYLLKPYEASALLEAMEKVA